MTEADALALLRAHDDLAAQLWQIPPLFQPEFSRQLFNMLGPITGVYR